MFFTFCSPQPRAVNKDRSLHGRLNRHQKPLDHVHWSISLHGRPRMSSQAWAQMGASCSHGSPFDAISASQLAIHLPHHRCERRNHTTLYICTFAQCCKQEKSSNGSMSGGLNVHGMSLMTDHADALTVYAAADTLNICSPKLGLRLHNYQHWTSFS